MAQEPFQHNEFGELPVPRMTDDRVSSIRTMLESEAVVAAHPVSHGRIVDAAATFRRRGTTWTVGIAASVTALLLAGGVAVLVTSGHSTPTGVADAPAVQLDANDLVVINQELVGLDAVRAGASAALAATAYIAIDDISPSDDPIDEPQYGCTTLAVDDRVGYFALAEGAPLADVAGCSSSGNGRGTYEAYVDGREYSIIDQDGVLDLSITDVSREVLDSFFIFEMTSLGDFAQLLTSCDVDVTLASMSYVLTPSDSEACMPYRDGRYVVRLDAAGRVSFIGSLAGDPSLPVDDIVGDPRSWTYVSTRTITYVDDEATPMLPAPSLDPPVEWAELMERPSDGQATTLAEYEALLDEHIARTTP